MIEIVEHGAVRELRLARPPANALSPELIVALAKAVGAAAEEAERAPRLSERAGRPGERAERLSGRAERPERPGEHAPGLGERAERPERVAALVLSGAPGMFSAGLDVPYLLTRDRGGIRDMWHDFYSLLRGLASSPLPLVAAITGHSPAGAAVLALYCDVRVMAAGDYRIGLNEVRVGLPMPPVILAAMRRLVGPRLAERLCVGGALLTAAEAERAGLVDEVVPPERVVERAVAVAAELAALPRAAMTETRRMARADLVALFDGGTRLEDTEVEGLLDAWFGDEAQTTMRALVERLARRRRRVGGGAAGCANLARDVGSSSRDSPGLRLRVARGGSDLRRHPPASRLRRGLFRPFGRERRNRRCRTARAASRQGSGGGGVPRLPDRQPGARDAGGSASLGARDA